MEEKIERRKWTATQKEKLLNQMKTLLEGGKDVQDACQALGISKSHYYNWRKQASGGKGKGSTNLPALISKKEKTVSIDLNRIAPSRHGVEQEEHTDITVMVFNGKPAAVGAALARLNRGGNA